MREIDSNELKSLQGENKKILLEVFTTWCSACKTLLPRLEKMEEDYSNITFVKINAELNTEFALNLGIRSVPTVIIYEGEKILNKSMGANTDLFYRNILNNV